MPLLLCHECFTWVEPHDERCPHCFRVLDASTPDPPLDELGRALGDVCGRLGNVSIRRKLLPGRGTLYRTTQGLFFAPHRVEHVIREATAPGAGASVFWTIAGMVSLPLVLAAALWRSQRPRRRRVPVYIPIELTALDSARLPRLLMENPGAFFLPWRAIRRVHAVRRGIVIERLDAAPLALHPLSSVRDFDGLLAESNTHQQCG